MDLKEYAGGCLMVFDGDVAAAGKTWLFPDNDLPSGRGAGPRRVAGEPRATMEVCLGQ